MITAQTLCQWLDLVWIPIALLTMEKGKRIFTCLFIGGCVLLLRLQVQLLQEIGFPKGFLGLMDTPLLMRGQITYSVFIMLFMVLAYFSKGTDHSVHIAASITIMLASFCVSMLVMVL